MREGERKTISVRVLEAAVCFALWLPVYTLIIEVHLDTGYFL